MKIRRLWVHSNNTNMYKYSQFVLSPPPRKFLGIFSMKMKVEKNATKKQKAEEKKK